jgi:hypothetical protein
VVLKVAWPVAIDGDVTFSSAEQMHTEHSLLTGRLLECPGVPRFIVMGETERPEGKVLVLVESPLGTSVELALGEMEEQVRF